MTNKTSLDVVTACPEGDAGDVEALFLYQSAHAAAD
jgi:hypothetical protein